MMNQWVSGILGLVVAIIPFLTLSATTLTWTLVIVGLAIGISSFWGVLAEPTDSHRSRGASSRV